MILDLTGVFHDGELEPPGVPVDGNPILRIVRGADVTIRFKAITEGGVPFDFSGGTVKLQVVRCAGQLPPSIDITLAADASLGIGHGHFAITHDQTRNLPPGRYLYDVWYTDGSGARDPLVLLSAFLIQPSAGAVP